MAESRSFDALIALGSVIRGEAYLFELLANESAAGIAAVQRDTRVPVSNAIIITDDVDQATVRMHLKGAEAALATIEMANLLKKFDGATQS